jgi:hypothetical protein
VWLHLSYIGFAEIFYNITEDKAEAGNMLLKVNGNEKAKLHEFQN